MLGTLLGIVAVILAAVSVHEAGHYLAARLQGMPARVRVNPYCGPCVVWAGTPGPWGRAAITAAGPAANLLAAGVLWAVGAPPLAAIVQAAFGVFNLFPLAGGPTAWSDGAKLLAAIRSRGDWDAAEAWLRRASGFLQAANKVFTAAVLAAAAVVWAFV